jgi:hypothetical protein
MLFRNSILLSAMAVVCASFVGVGVAVSSPGAANPKAMASKAPRDLQPTDGLSANDPPDPDASQATLEERVALYKARIEEWTPPPRLKGRATPVGWQASRVRSRSKITAAIAGGDLPPILGAGVLAAEPETLASLRAGGDQHCLATAIYYEARNQPLEGQEAVAQVIMNRVGKTQFSDSVCGVVAQGGERRGCQFSFVCDGSMSRPPRDGQAWATAEDVAARMLRGAVASSVGGATFYHASYVSPWWSKVLPRVAQIGAHIFYDGLDVATSGALRSGPLLGKPLAPPLGAQTAHNSDAPLLPGGLFGGA